MHAKGTSKDLVRVIFINIYKTKGHFPQPIMEIIPKTEDKWQGLSTGFHKEENNASTGVQHVSTRDRQEVERRLTGRRHMSTGDQQEDDKRATAGRQLLNRDVNRGMGKWKSGKVGRWNKGEAASSPLVRKTAPWSIFKKADRATFCGGGCSTPP